MVSRCDDGSERVVEGNNARARPSPSQGDSIPIPKGVVVVSGCVHHTGLYVCRRHPAEIRCSVEGTGDGLGYYGNGLEGWEATFWDCCGREERDDPGCCISTHVKF